MAAAASTKQAPTTTEATNGKEPRRVLTSEQLDARSMMKLFRQGAEFCKEFIATNGEAPSIKVFDRRVGFVLGELAEYEGGE